ncbi:MAG: outer rane efflux protein [Bryobacterales bacterium]|nr:outer rane efflux protein [Bryobacterales bacterium]
MMRAWIALVTVTLPMFAQAPRKLTLQEAETLAVQQHPQIAGAKLATQAAGQVIRETRSPLYPQLSANATAVGAVPDSRIAAGFLNAPTVLNRAAAGVSLQQLITDFGRTSHLVESSKLREQSQEAGEIATRASVLLDVDRAYFRALRAQAVVKTAQETVNARQLVVDQVTALAQSALKSQLDVSFASVNLADAKLLLSTAQNEVQEAFTDLSTALGLTQPQTFDLAEAAVASAPETDASGLIQQALQQRPELAGLRLDRDAALQFAQAERALVRPTVTAAAAAGGVPAHDSNLHGRYAAAGINVTIPVFNGKLFAARRTEADLRAQAASEHLRDAENRVAHDVNVAWLSTSNAFQRIGLTDQLLAQANLAMDLAQSRYDLGLSSIVELGQAQLNKTGAEIQNLTARYDFQIQSAVLKYQVGLLR